MRSSVCLGALGLAAVISASPVVRDRPSQIMFSRHHIKPGFPHIQPTVPVDVILPYQSTPPYPLRIKRGAIIPAPNQNDSVIFSNSTRRSNVNLDPTMKCILGQNNDSLSSIGESLDALLLSLSNLEGFISIMNSPGKETSSSTYNGTDTGTRQPAPTFASTDKHDYCCLTKSDEPYCSYCTCESTECCLINEAEPLCLSNTFIEPGAVIAPVPLDGTLNIPAGKCISYLGPDFDDFGKFQCSDSSALLALKYCNENEYDFHFPTPLLVVETSWLGINCAVEQNVVTGEWEALEKFTISIERCAA